MSRRNMLAALGVAGAAAASLPVLSACGVGGKASAPNGADAVSGGFDWKKASGHDHQHPADPAPVPAVVSAAAQGVHRTHRHQRQRRPGAGGRLLHQAQHRAGGRLRQARRVHARCLLHLAVRSARLDRGSQPVAAEHVRPPTRTTTSRTSSTVCARPPAGTSHSATRWAPAGSGRSRGASRTTSSPTTRGSSTRRASRSCPTDFDDFIQLAVDLTDRSAEPLRHLHPRVEVVGHHPSRAS